MSSMPMDIKKATYVLVGSGSVSWTLALKKPSYTGSKDNYPFLRLSRIYELVAAN